MVDIVNPVTPTDRKLFLTTADKEDSTAQSAAALQKADAAEATANSAKSSSTAALSASNTATSTATEAHSVATGAATTAGQASSAATQANSTAESARTIATNAASKADQASTAAGTANTTASTAKTTADAAKNSAAIADLLARAAFDSADIIALSATGTATFNFTTPYDAKPILRYMAFNPDTSKMPVIIEAVEWIMGTGPTAGKYIGVKLQGYRAQKMGTQNQLTLATLLTGVITGLNSLITIVSGFNAFGGTAFTGIEVHITARTRTLPQT